MNNEDLAIRFAVWTHIFREVGGDNTALYHSLNMEVVYLKSEFQRCVELLSLGTTLSHLRKDCHSITDQLSDVVAELVRTGIVVPVEQNDMELLVEKRKIYVLPPGLETLYLMVTDNCNLRCRYCFIYNNMPTNYCHTTMTFATAKKMVDLFFSNISRNPPEYEKLKKTIFFYGGEPLLNFDLIKQVIEYIESTYTNELAQMGTKFRFSIVTNGTLITEKIAKFVGAHSNLDIAISIDGPEELHDSERLRVNGKGSFAGAIRGYQLLKLIGEKADVSISCTIGEHNIDKLPLLLELHKQYGFATINLNPLLDTASSPISTEHIHKVSVRMLEYFELAREHGVYEDRVMRKAKSFMDKNIHAYDCQALGAQLACSPDGQLGVCHEGIGMKQFFFAKASPDFDFHSNPMIREWKRRTPLNMPQCYRCPALGICGGGCAYGAWLRNGSIWSLDDRFCIHSLKTLEWLIWDLFQNL
jgi:uncharacterized protein